MKAVLCALSVTVAWASLARADMKPPPFATKAISQNGHTVVRIVPGKWNGDRRQPKDQVSIYSYDAEKDSYVRMSTFDLGNLYPSEKLFVSDNGQYLILINIGHWVRGDSLGVRAYNTKGELLGRWKISEFLTPKQIQASMKTGSTTQWFDDGAFYDDEFRFIGPAEVVKGWGSSVTVMRSGDPNECYSFSLNLKKLELLED